MVLRNIWMCATLAGCLVSVAVWRTSPVLGFSTVSTPDSTPAATSTSDPGWNRAAAASYLDSRQLWWQSWPKAQRDHGTICISCHTVVPYAMSRSTLRSELHESGEAAPEKVLLDNVETRVSRWSEMVPFYSDAKNGAGKTAESHSTEAVMNAVILASYDQREGHLRLVTQAALSAAWALQQQTGDDAGGWLWQDFHLAPWESAESAYQGAAMLMLEVGTAPELFAQTPDNQLHIARLQAYLRQHYAAQPLLNQLYVLWASAKAPGLLDASQRTALFKTVLDLQQSDGGWRLSSLEQRERSDKTPQPTDSDAFATALVVLCMEATPAKHPDPTLGRGLAWLEQHQEKDGKWRTSSLNKQRDPESDVGLFMSDAATGYAVLALEQAAPSPHPAGPSTHIRASLK